MAEWAEVAGHTPKEVLASLCEIADTWPDMPDPAPRSYLRELAATKRWELVLATADRFSDDVSLFIQELPGVFTPAATTLQAGDLPGALAIGDLNGDGDLDLATANAFSHDVTIFFPAKAPDAMRLTSADR